MTPSRLIVAAACLGICGLPAPAQNADVLFQDDFDAGDAQWQPYFEAGNWSVTDGVYRGTSPQENSARLAKVSPLADVLVEAEVRVGETGRANFGLVLRAQADRSCAVVRYYDREDRLELLRYDRGAVTQVPGKGERLNVRRGRWLRLKAAVSGELVLGKIWPEGQTEPAWQLQATTADLRAGGVGLIAQDGSSVEFRNVHVRAAPPVNDLRRAIANAKKEEEKRRRELLTLQVDPTPFVLRNEKGPLRRVIVRTLAEGRPEPVAGKLVLDIAGTREEHAVALKDLVNDAYPVHLPEPAEPVEILAVFEADFGKRLEAKAVVKPARQWTFYMTPHTHYDIGFTHPQPEVIERLSKDMDLAVAHCHETADWPAESRYRWTVEVSGLMKNYIDRHTPEQVARLIDLVRQGRIEICGYYLNMPTELTGHEETIRCLYYAQELRRKYGVTIDTAMLNDVPGYAWSLPELFTEAGITRVSFRANSIRGRFLWYRPGAVPRPFYWEGPAGDRVLLWYTDSYREGNFFRAPGLFEDEFRGIINRNEQAGGWVDHIQLRMGGDNLPPEINASRNARAWNEKYVWPKVVVATNREFLEILESRYGPRCKTFRGDIPSWWADGPASSAKETGINRLLHDRLVAAEGLWTRARLQDPAVAYPRDEINAAWDRMIHFDEHTWGASESVSAPHSENTRKQWAYKAAFAADAERMTNDLYRRALRLAARGIRGPAGHAVAVWNTLGWSRSDVVEVPLAGTPLEGADGVAVTDARGDRSVAAQLSTEGRSVFFVANDVPSHGYAVFVLRAAPAAEAPPPPADGTLENRFYRVVAGPESGGLLSWYDKELRRELADTRAPHRLNQPIYERPNGNRQAIDNVTRRVDFTRTLPKGGRLLSQRRGPVFQEMTLETSLPTCPRILQTIRLYEALKAVDITNVFTKQEYTDPEAVYIAFPFDVPQPEWRLQIANAIMRPGKDQLTYSCQDYYSIQHWAHVAGPGFGVAIAPIEAPLVLCSDLHVGKWADRNEFDNGRLFSWVMNNYWYTNFRAGQEGEIPFRYRLTSHAGPHDGAAVTRFAWQPFYPLEPVWLTEADAAPTPPESLLRVEGDPVIVGCIKLAEARNAVIVRLLEMQGKPAQCTLRWTLPGGRRIVRAGLADAVERPGGALPVIDSAVTVSLRANDIVTTAFEIGE